MKNFHATYMQTCTQLEKELSAEQHTAEWKEEQEHMRVFLVNMLAYIHEYVFETMHGECVQHKGTQRETERDFVLYLHESEGV